jgi:sterol desaturase/sphingolipid hydroxylase (fatty acid hydroxylase superfamily)
MNLPSPIDVLLDPVSMLIISLYAVLMIAEAFFPGRKLPYIKHWKVKGMVVFVLFFYISSYLPLFINPLLEPYRLLDLTSTGTLGGSIIGVLLYEFGVFVWHRAMHKSNFLWKTFHQMHHSAERLDTYGAFFFSPLDMMGWTVLSSICFSLVIALTPQAITFVILFTNFLTIFQHANIKTPQWLGYLVQRPESHTHHHAKGIHEKNYSDLPIFDIMFGTFYNPATFEHETGFYHGASERVGDMLLFKDVSVDPSEKKKEHAHDQTVLL